MALERITARSTHDQRWSKLADESDFRLQVDTELLLDRLLREMNQGLHVPGCGIAEVHDDVGVQRGNLGAADLVPLQSRLINQPAGSQAIEFLED